MLIEPYDLLCPLKHWLILRHEHFELDRLLTHHFEALPLSFDPVVEEAFPLKQFVLEELKQTMSLLAHLPIHELNSAYANDLQMIQALT